MLRKALAAAIVFSVAATPAFAGGPGKDKSAAPTADIVDTAVAAGQFNTLAAALQAAGLVETLKGPGPFTVFAPTDAAFAKLPARTVDTLLKAENKAQLTSVLTYHVLAGKTKSNQLVGKTLAVKTVNGAELNVDGTDGVKVNSATVIKADIWTSNGVIHVIDTVLLPPTN